MSKSDFLAAKAATDVGFALGEAISDAFQQRRQEVAEQQHYNDKLALVTYNRDQWRKSYEMEHELSQNYRRIAKREEGKVEKLREMYKELDEKYKAQEKRYIVLQKQRATTTWTKSALISAMANALEAYEEGKPMDPLTLFGKFDDDTPGRALTRIKHHIDTRPELKGYLEKDRKEILDRYDEIRTFEGKGSENP